MNIIIYIPFLSPETVKLFMAVLKKLILLFTFLNLIFINLVKTLWCNFAMWCWIVKACDCRIVLRITCVTNKPGIMTR